MEHKEDEFVKATGHTKDELKELLAEAERTEVEKELEPSSQEVPPEEPRPQPLPPSQPIPLAPVKPPEVVQPAPVAPVKQLEPNPVPLQQPIQQPVPPRESIPEWGFQPGGKKPSRIPFMNRYPILAALFESRAGSGTFVFFDRVGRFKKKTGLGFEYRLKKKKKKLPTAQFENLMESNNRRVLLIDHPEEDVFRPMSVNNGLISAKETAWKEIFMNNVERAHTLLTRRGFMERYMPMILLIVMGVMMIMALYVVRTDMAIILQQAREAFSIGFTAVQTPLPGV